MALLLAAGLGIAGIAMTTQAADAYEVCQHKTLYYYKKLVRIFYYDYKQHAYYYKSGYECTNPECDYTTMVTDGYSYEDHDYEQTYYPDGRVESVCTVCGDYYFW